MSSYYLRSGDFVKHTPITVDRGEAGVNWLQQGTKERQKEINDELNKNTKNDNWWQIAHQNAQVRQTYSVNGKRHER